MFVFHTRLLLVILGTLATAVAAAWTLCVFEPDARVLLVGFAALLGTCVVHEYVKHGVAAHHARIQRAHATTSAFYDAKFDATAWSARAEQVICVAPRAHAWTQLCDLRRNVENAVAACTQLCVDYPGNVTHWTAMQRDLVRAMSGIDSVFVHLKTHPTFYSEMTYAQVASARTAAEGAEAAAQRAELRGLLLLR
jgi:hypothetical protein